MRRSRSNRTADYTISRGIRTGSRAAMGRAASIYMMPPRQCSKGWSEAEHMIEAEGPVAAQEAVIAEQAAGRVADDRIGAGAGASARLGIEHLAVAPQTRP